MKKNLSKFLMKKYFLIGQFLGSFSFLFIFSTECRTIDIPMKILLKFVFEPEISGTGSDLSAKCTTIYEIENKR